MRKWRLGGGGQMVVALFVVQFLLAFNITLSPDSVVDPQTCKHQRTFLNGFRWMVPLHLDVCGTVQTHREGKSKHISNNIHIHIYMQTHIHVLAKTHLNIPTSVPAPGIKPPVAHLYGLPLPCWLQRVQMSARKAGSAGCSTSPCGNSIQMMADSAWASYASLLLFLSAQRSI